ncbi:hypothetical protein BC477_04080 [Clavibacter michiganensis subsp. michiganensis]|uniref:Uncharacterized protein n=1 Tax=Clavibacter michiganensis subsp. michiganensis TaxID=33013 RepID=A0A251XKJ0_CLAMM|nr:hypothetical protein BC477_04080 [Clavibacter michiganensis subsp. michiganensis]OUE03890.1 hypothetical protein CMMCAS07_03015 [Clavibacter michiganensis subsp. michiganensis]
MEQSAAVNCSPVWHAPRKVVPSPLAYAIADPSRYGSAPAVVPSGSPANAGFSGAMPVSMTPMTAPSPAFS